MWTFLWLVCVFVALLLGVGLLVDLDGIKKFSKITNGRLAASVLGLILVSPIFYEYPPYGGIIAIERDGKTVVKKGGTFVWEWGKFANIPANSVAGAVSQSSVLTVLTDNPKSRTFYYALSAYVVNPVVFLNNNPNRWERWSVEDSKYYNVRNLVKYWCYEFNEANSRKVAQLYNPDDPNQQKQFADLLESWMNERLEKEGIEVKSGGFTIQ